MEANRHFGPFLGHLPGRARRSLAEPLGPLGFIRGAKGKHAASA